MCGRYKQNAAHADVVKHFQLIDAGFEVAALGLQALQCEQRFAISQFRDRLAGSDSTIVEIDLFQFAGQLDIAEGEEGHRRVLAVITHLRAVHEWS